MKKCVQTIGFTADEVIVALLGAAFKQSRILPNLWKEMCDNDKNKEYSYTITYIKDFAKVEIFHDEAKL